MRATVLNEAYELVDNLEFEPICGEDFCDHCWDCLVCEPHLWCYDGTGQHYLVVYGYEALREFRELHDLHD